jgi:hypothetical protein
VRFCLIKRGWSEKKGVNPRRKREKREDFHAECFSNDQSKGENEVAKIYWSALWKKDTWWACWVGWFILLLAIGGMLPKAVSIGTWTEPSKALPQGCDP